MTAPTPLTIREQQFWLSADRGIFWEQESSLILADLHFGKTGHFRKNGINVPAAVYKEDLQRMVDLISFFQPKKIIADENQAVAEKSSKKDKIAKKQK